MKPQFWIDVGGTFTDCFLRQPNGELVRHKVLSSGVTKGRVAQSQRNIIEDPGRQRDPHRFWDGYTLALLDEKGQELARTRVAEFRAAEGRLVLAEPLSVEPRPGLAYELTSGEEAPIVAIRWLLGLRLTEPIPPVSVRLGTTRGTNALLERKGAFTALVTTRGFGDILKIGYQNRPRLFDLAIQKRVPLDQHVIEIDERLGVDGTVLKAPDAEAIRRQLAEAKLLGVESLAICLLHGYAHPAHEELVAKIAREVGFTEVSISHRLASLIKIVARGDTTVMDAYLNPVLRTYVTSLEQSLAGKQTEQPRERSAADFALMTSSGGLVSAQNFVGKDSILSGPAGGVVGFSRVAQAAGFERAIGFDMGGTSTDVSRFDGRFELEYETEKAGVRVVAPMMAIETVAAGGGSICWFDGVKLCVGPASAGSQPGPACYGRGGPLAVTDLNFYLGKIPAEKFPFPLDRAAVEARLNELIEQIAAGAGQRYTPVELADGFLRVANANMVKPIRSISIAKGYDPRDYVLVAFGGAAGQHACAVARELGMRQVLIHPDAGLLSAYGIGLADIVRHGAQGVYQPYSEEKVAELESVFAELEAKAVAEVRAELGVGALEGNAPEVAVRRFLDIRYKGLDAFLTIPETFGREFSRTEGRCAGRPADVERRILQDQLLEDDTYSTAYQAEHKRLYGYVQEQRPLEIVAVRVEATGKAPPFSAPLLSIRTTTELRSEDLVLTCFAGEWHNTPVFRRDVLRAGDCLPGPAIILEGSSTTVVDPGWGAEVLKRGEIVLVDIARPLDQAEQQVVDASEKARHTAAMGETSNAKVVRMMEELLQAGATSSYSWPNLPARPDWWARMLHMEEALRADSIPHEAVLRQARKLVTDGKLAETLALLRQSIEVDPSNSAVWQMFAILAGPARTAGGVIAQAGTRVRLMQAMLVACRDKLWPEAVRATLDLLEFDPGNSDAIEVMRMLQTHFTPSHEMAQSAWPVKHTWETKENRSQSEVSSTAPDPVLLEIFNNQFAGIAEQMGITLRNTSSSVNVKERLDFSCAIFTAVGDLVVNAPHIPVHLGAMSITVKSILADNPTLRPGDVFVTNDPYRGGSHLPDVTVVTPVFSTGDQPQLLFFTASRAHHAEIGGSRAGSMPPFSKCLAEEGVLIENFKLVDAGQSRFEELSQVLTGAPLPTRNVADNLADLTAQVAANHQGVTDLLRMIERHGQETVLAYMRHIQDAAERKMRAALGRIPAGRYEFEEHLDDGSPIAVAVTIRHEERPSAVISFSGTGKVLPGNLNANLAIVSSAVMYVMRCLIDEDIPLNQGVLAPLEIVVPENTLLNPQPGPSPTTSPAVVGGNVETSQRVVDTLLGALGLAAASQGTMNNLLFGDRTFGYYETICGGAGAVPPRKLADGQTRPAMQGADAVHTHMTNTRLTDPEVLELRYPVRLHEFSIRQGSGGPGQERGGNGIVRKIEFLRALDVSILSQRRGPYQPYGLGGGQAGQLGKNTLRRTADGIDVPLPALVEFAAQPGDVLTIETPGGGGWGKR